MNNIVNLMDKIKNPGAFSVFGEMEPVPLGLSVKGVGTISLPICTPQANALINVSQQG